MRARPATHDGGRAALAGGSQPTGDGPYTSARLAYDLDDDAAGPLHRQAMSLPPLLQATPALCAAGRFRSRSEDHERFVRTSSSSGSWSVVLLTSSGSGDASSVEAVADDPTPVLPRRFYSWDGDPIPPRFGRRGSEAYTPLGCEHPAPVPAVLALGHAR
jgi:hypothetical protein